MNLTLQSIPSTVITEIICNSDLDGVVLDTEHGYFNNETLFSCIQICTLSHKKCFVRFADLNKQLVRMCLDADIDGVILSTVETLDQANQFISYCTYPMHGGNRGCALVRENKWGTGEIGRKKPTIIGQIETQKGVDNIKNLINCSFDTFVIGPYDLSASLGCPAEWNNAQYVKYINTIYDEIPHNKLGAFLPSNRDIKLFLNSKRKRPSLLVWGLDVNFIMEAIKELKIMENLK